MQKHGIFLTLAGLKPVSEASSSHLVATDYGSERVPDDPAEVAQLLDRLGLRHRIMREPHYLLVQVSLSEECLKQYEAAGRLSLRDMYMETGRLFGYPMTAVEAYAEACTTDRDLRLTGKEQEAAERAAGIPQLGARFRLSREHWQAELAVLSEWSHVLRQYGLLTSSS